MSIIKNNRNYGIETKITQAPPQVQYDQLIFTNVSGVTNRLNINLSDRYIKDCSYSLDEGATWTALPADTEGVTTTSQTINFTDRLYVRWSQIYLKINPNGGLFSVSEIFNLSGDLYKFYNYHYFKLFPSNTKLKDASGLIFHSKTIPEYCCYQMFYGCTSLTAAPALPATDIASYCYYEMFRGCSALTTAPALPAITLVSSCYQYMFRDCTSLTTAPALPATALANNCYNQMFYGCTSLTTAPALPATNLANACYSSMFSNCTSLTTAPVLPATTLTNACYQKMFQGCTSLNRVETYANNISASGCITNWLDGVSAQGDFFNLGTATYTAASPSGIPSGWTTHTSL